MERFKGTIVHPQTWPEDLDYAGKNVVVIGSGATAATLIPAMARRRAATSPCCSARRPTSAPAATRSSSPTSCASLQIDEAWIHEIVRRKILHEQAMFTRRASPSPRR